MPWPTHDKYGNKLGHKGGMVNGARQQAKTHCKHGHPFDDVNTYRHTRPDGKSFRGCKMCRAIQRKRWTDDSTSPRLTVQPGNKNKLDKSII